MIEEKRYCTVREFQALHPGLSKYAIYQCCEDRTIPFIKSGNRYLIDNLVFEERCRKGVVNG